MKKLVFCMIGVFSLAANAVDIVVETFDAGVPGSWTVIDNEGTGVSWSDIATCGEAGNFVNGNGDAACASSDSFGAAAYDTELLTPSMDLTNFTGTMLDYSVNFQNFAALDFFDVDVSTDGGTAWTTELSWNEDHGAFRAVPGETVNIDLSAYDGQADVIVRFRWYDPNPGADFNWYVQVDDVTISGTAVAVGPPQIIPTLNTWMLILMSVVLMMVGTITIRRKNT
jgi:hypothetical protein